MAKKHSIRIELNAQFQDAAGFYWPLTPEVVHRNAAETREALRVAGLYPIAGDAEPGYRLDCLESLASILPHLSAGDLGALDIVAGRLAGDKVY